MLWGVSTLKCSVFQKNYFSRFSIDRICLSIDQNCNNKFWLESAWLDWYSIDARSIEIEKFSVSKFLTKFFFTHHLCLGFTCIALIFGIYLAVLQSYLWLFSHIICRHFAKNWLINFLSYVLFSICYFYVWTAENIFLKRYDW